MSLLWLRQWAKKESRSPRSPGRGQRSVRPTLEHLEDRRLMSAAPSDTVANVQLYIDTTRNDPSSSAPCATIVEGYQGSLQFLNETGGNYTVGVPTGTKLSGTVNWASGPGSTAAVQVTPMTSNIPREDLYTLSVPNVPDFVSEEKGTKLVSLDLTDTDPSVAAPATAHLEFAEGPNNSTGTFVVNDAPIAPVAVDPVHVAVGATDPVTVASFTDADQNETDPGTYTANIDWYGNGQGTPATQIVAGNTPGTFNVLGIPPYATSGTYDIKVKIQDIGGESTLAANTVQVRDATAPVITSNPVSQTVNEGTDVTFAASASGTLTLAAQWQVSTDGGQTFNDIAGATNTTLTLNNVTTDRSGNAYRAVFTNGAGTATTSAATLTVNPANASSITFSPGALPNGLAGHPYLETIEASGGTGNLTLTYEITSPTQPGDLNLNFNTDAFPGTLTIGGSPNAGTISFKVIAIDSTGKPQDSPIYSIRFFNDTVQTASSAPSSPPPQALSPVDQLFAEFEQVVAAIEAEIQQVISAEMAIVNSLLHTTPKVA